MAGASAGLEAEAFLKAFGDLGLIGMAMEEERKTAESIIERAQSIVHIGGPDDPNAGQTRESLAWGDALYPGGEGSNYIDLGSMLEKAFYEEFGSVHGPAVSFLRIAMAEALGGSGSSFGVSWSQMQRPRAISKARKAQNAALRAARGH